MKLLVGISVKLKREKMFQLNIKGMGPITSLYLGKELCYFSEEIIYTQLTKINYLDFA